MIVIVSNLYGWEINTHRAIERKALEASSNLAKFVKSAGIKNQNYDSEMFDGYGMTYIQYVTHGETNGISNWRQIFNGKPGYQNMIEAGGILEDAQWPHGWIKEHIGWWDQADGRFNNHFADPQDTQNPKRT